MLAFFYFFSPIAGRAAPLLKKWAKYMPLLFVLAFVVLAKPIFALFAAAILFWHKKYATKHLIKNNAFKLKAPAFFYPWFIFSALILIDVFFRQTALRSLDITHKILIALLFYYLLPALRLRVFINILSTINFAFLTQALYQVFILHVERAQGTLNNAILFGDFAILNSILIIIYVLKNQKNQLHPKSFIILAYLGALTGILAAIYSQTRSAFLVLLLFGFYYISIYIKNIFTNSQIKINKLNILIKENKKYPQHFLSIFRLLIIFMIVVVIIFITLDIILQKYQESLDELVKIQQNQYHSSLGLRFQMWHLAIVSMTKYPFWGIGFDQYFTHIYYDFYQQCMMRKNLYCPPFNHPHNDLLAFLANWGAIGGIVFILIFAMPYYYFKQKTKNLRDMQKPYPNPSNQNTCEMKQIMINCLLFAYFCFGLTQAMFAHHQGILFFLLLMAMLAKVHKI